MFSEEVETFVMTPFSKPLQLPTPHVKPVGNYGLSVSMRRHCRSMAWGSFSALVWDADNGGQYT